MEVTMNPVMINEFKLGGKVTKVYKTYTTENNKKLKTFHIVHTTPQGTRSFMKCMAWGDTTKEVESLDVGDEILVVGRYRDRCESVEDVFGDKQFLQHPELIVSDIIKL